MAGVFEGGLVEAAGFQPYSGEPAGVAETETGDKEQVAGPAPVDRTQLVVSDWCKCGNCSRMASSEECLCCQEVPKIVRKLGTASCITLAYGFREAVLHPVTLETAFYGYRQHYGVARNEFNHQIYRHQAYRQLVRWCWGWLGKDVRVVLPSCAVDKIRASYPDSTYVGFRPAEDPEHQ